MLSRMGNHEHVICRLRSSINTFISINYRQPRSAVAGKAFRIWQFSRKLLMEPD
jgi:hypothetical protein